MDSLYTPLLWACTIAFLASAPLCLALRARRPQQVPWWLVVVLAAALGWILSHVYACLETAQIQAWRTDLLQEGALADFFSFAPPSFTLYWGWTFGLTYLVTCLTLYRLVRENINSRPFRPFGALLTALVLLAVFSALPPWRSSELALPFEFAALYAGFLFCAGLSHHLLRWLRLEAAWWPFVVMFLVSFLLRQIPWALTVVGTVATTDSPPRIQEPAEWAALFGGLFTAAWWIAIRGAKTDTTLSPGKDSPSRTAPRVSHRTLALSGVLMLAAVFLVAKILYAHLLETQTDSVIAPAGQLHFGSAGVGNVGFLPTPESGPERLRGRLTLDGAGLEGARLALTLNNQYRVRHLHTDSHGVFEIPLDAGQWHVNDIVVNDWKGRPKDRDLILFSNHEPMKRAGQYLRFNFHMPDGLEVSLPTTANAIPVEIEFRDAISMIWPPHKGTGTAPEGQLATAAIAWRPVKGASEYEVQIGYIEDETMPKFSSLPILTRHLSGVSLPLASLPQRPASTLADEYSVHVFAFDAEGRLLTESNLEFDDPIFKLTGPARLGHERQYVGFDGPLEVISAE